MRIDILTLFPDMCYSVLSESILKRARGAGLIEINCRDIRAYTKDKHHRVDDSPYGGGYGLIMQTQPIYDCFMSLCDELGKRPHLVYMSPQGQVLTQEKVKELSKLDNLALLCGHYEGVDERILDEIVDEEISIGDYVLTGGELPALVIADAVTRMQPGVLAADEAFEKESHFSGLLEYPQYTRPFDWHGAEVPEILLSGHHANIERWQREQSLMRTFDRRPDLLSDAELSDADKKFLKKYIEEKNSSDNGETNKAE
ncbi:MAG: tRNA (guanosine(37)-N1)-methyltransferase TrmD [Clostridiales bacterium]|nr:tRNA (guanosine(37)-N1)-methyltransferase TrmD [Clostridiales bacterium]